MKFLNFWIIGLAMSCCQLAFAQAVITTNLSSTIMVSDSSKKIYHDYALSKAKQKWGDVEGFNPDQLEAIKKIEDLYAKLDADYQQKNQSNYHSRYEKFLKQGENQAFYPHLNILYRTDTGKDLSQKTAIFDLEIQNALINLPLTISTQPTLQINMENAIQKGKL